MAILGRFLPILAFAASVALAGGASAGELKSHGIIYNKATKSYFELRDDLKGWNAQWPGAAETAQRHAFHGVSGRLAVVRDQATMNFIRKNFDVRGDIWIGARYFCSFNKLVWVNGEIQKQTDYSKWAAQWHRTNIRCPNVSWMPVYLRWFRNDTFWQASGPGKAFTRYLIEYPTGGR